MSGLIDTQPSSIRLHGAHHMRSPGLFILFPVTMDSSRPSFVTVPFGESIGDGAVAIPARRQQSGNGGPGIGWPRLHGASGIFHHGMARRIVPTIHSYCLVGPQ